MAWEQWQWKEVKKQELGPVYELYYVGNGNERLIFQTIYKDAVISYLQSVSESRLQFYKIVQDDNEGWANQWFEQESKRKVATFKDVVQYLGELCIVYDFRVLSIDRGYIVLIPVTKQGWPYKNFNQQLVYALSDLSDIEVLENSDGKRRKLFGCPACSKDDRSRFAVFNSPLNINNGMCQKCRKVYDGRL